MGDLPVGVHLVGSIPLGSSEQVFRRTAAVLGDRLRRIPDGETGPRADWIAWQYPVFSAQPAFAAPVPAGQAGSYRSLAPLALRGGRPPRAFGELGYAMTAIASYRVFERLKRDGVVPQRCRLLVSLPTPLAPVSAFVAAEDQATVEPGYEQRMRLEIEEILDAVPADQLAIQWDARYEFSMLEGAVDAPFADVRAGIEQRLLRLGESVPAEVELGFHLCYGDEEHGHFIEPSDSGELVAVANVLAAGLERTLDWIHMPVPAERADHTWFAPLEQLALQPSTELYLGLISPKGADATRARIDAARMHLADFGVATECGWGRGDADAVEGLLALHREVSAPL